jgi:hypothetical protein
VILAMMISCSLVDVGWKKMIRSNLNVFSKGGDVKI